MSRSHSYAPVIAFLFLSCAPTPCTHAQGLPQNSQSELTNAIQADIRDAVRIADADVRVQVRNGIATLSGTVNSLMDRRRAVSIAKRTRGIAAVADQIIVKKSDRKDSEILADVQKVLRINDSVEQQRITSQVKNSVVSLLGAVDSLAEKRIAEMAAGGVRGVVDVESQITIRPNADRTDREMRDEIAGLLVHSIYLDDVMLDVRVKDATASLSGVVGSLQQRDHAQQLAEVRGVLNVDGSGISIDASKLDPTERKRRFASVSDDKIAAAAKQLLASDPIVVHSSEGIEANVKRGVVTLSGTTNSLVAKKKAERLASDVIGTRRVVNELEVQRAAEQISDVDIIRDVQEAIRRSPYIERREVRVHSQRAHVSLYGIVESELEKQIAGWLADNVPGVVHVSNRLAVEKEWTKKPDEQIKNDLERKLKFTLLETGSDINVAVENGVAILRGEVDSWRQWQAAMELALEAGAKHSHNLLNVRYHPPHGGSRIYIGY